MDFSFTAEEEAFRSRLRSWLEEASGELFGRKGDGMGASTASLLDVGDDSNGRAYASITGGSTRPATSRCTGQKNGVAVAPHSSSKRFTRTRYCDWVCRFTAPTS